MLFSVIVPAYNAEQFVLRGVQSVLSQTYSDFEIIVVNDGSKDKTLEILNTINDKRLVVIDQPNQGVSVARNTGIKNSKGEYICFLDADDEYLPDCLNRIAGLIQKYQVKKFFVTTFCVGLLTGKVIMPKVSNKDMYIENVVNETQKRPELVWTGCVFIHRDMFTQYGMFEPGVKLGEDTDMWKRVYVHSGIVYADTITTKRNRDGSEATKYYSCTRDFEVDPLNRIKMFLSDATISDEIKDSLIVGMELSKVSVARSYLLVGDRKSARKIMNSVDKTRVSIKRKLITYICFLIPSKLLRMALNIKNIGMYR